MRKFKVIAGSHVENKKVYSKGQIVRTERDLVKMFAGKFVEMGAPQSEEEVVHEEEDTKAKIAAATTEAPPAPATKSAPAEGDDDWERKPAPAAAKTAPAKPKPAPAKPAGAKFKVPKPAQE